MNLEQHFDAAVQGAEPPLALAPMQDVTHLPFWRIMARYGGVDLYYTEYMRVHSVSRPERWIVDSILQNPTGQPVIAQIIGNDIPSILRTIPLLQALPIAAIDLNLGCPAPVVYKKCAGGGLLRELPLVDRLLGAMRDAIPGRFTVKTRIGFDDPVTDALVPLLQKHRTSSRSMAAPSWKCIVGASTTTTSATLPKPCPARSSPTAMSPRQTWPKKPFASPEPKAS